MSLKLMDGVPSTLLAIPWHVQPRDVQLVDQEQADGSWIKYLLDGNFPTSDDSCGCPLPGIDVLYFGKFSFALSSLIVS